MSSARKPNARRPVSAAGTVRNGAKTEPGAYEELKGALDKLTERNSHSFDGVLGQPPTWVPFPLKDEFWTVRNRLLDECSPQQVATWMRACRALSSYPFEYAREIEALVYIKQIADLGERDGIEAYLGIGRCKVARAYTERPQTLAEIIDGHNQELQVARNRFGGLEKAKAKREKNAERDGAIRMEAQLLRAKGKSDRSIPTMLELRKKWMSPNGNPLSRRQIQRILKNQFR
jgi:hypothetical protein